MAKKTNKVTPAQLDAATTSGSPNDGPAGVDLGVNPELTALYVTRKFDSGRSDTVRERFNYWINYAFWSGSQWVHLPKGFIDSSTIEPLYLSAKERRTKATINKIEPAVTNVVSRLSKVPLTIEVLAQAADDFTHAGAIRGEGILRMKGLSDDWEELKEEIVTAALLGGTSALVTEWDAKANRYSPDVTTGDGKLSVLSIEDFVVEPGALKGKTARWWIRKQVLPPEQVQADYELEHLPPVDDVAGGPFSAKAIQFDHVLSAKRGTRVLTYFERPNYLRPKGAVAVVINHKIVFQSDWPYPFTDRLNIDVCRAKVVPGRWTGEATVTQAISPQRQLNQLWTKVHETVHRTAGSKMLVDERHANVIKNINDDPEIPVVLSAADGAREPKYMTPPQLPAQVMQQLEMLEQAIQDCMGVHNISQGETPVNAPDSGYGLSLLAEQDSTPAGRLAKEVARVFSSASSNLLELYAAKVTDTRTTPVRNGRSVRTVKWTGKDLAGQTTAFVPPDSVLPRSHAAILKLATDLAASHPQWFPSLTSFLRFAGAPGFENMVEQADADTAKADWENGRMAEGEPQLVDVVDNDATHLHEHLNFMKTPEFLLLDKKTQQLFRVHIDGHHAAEAHKQGVAASMQAANPMLGATTLGRGIGPTPGMPMPMPGGAVPPGAVPEGGPPAPPVQ